jgi:hypothetical protein
MVMFSGFLSSSPYSQLPLVLALSYLLCKNLLMDLFPFFVEAFFISYKLSTYHSFSIFFFCLCSTIFIFMLALVGVFYPYNRGALFTALVVIYALTSGIAGYTATSFYIQLEGSNWVRMDCLH